MHELVIERRKINPSRLEEELTQYVESGKIAGFVTQPGFVRIPVLANLSRTDELAIRALVENHDEKQESQLQATRKKVMTALQNVTGANVNDLDTTEVRALLAGIAFRLGIVDRSGALKPPDEWLD